MPRIFLLNQICIIDPKAKTKKKTITCVLPLSSSFSLLFLKDLYHFEASCGLFGHGIGLDLGVHDIFHPCQATGHPAVDPGEVLQRTALTPGGDTLQHVETALLAHQRTWRKHDVFGRETNEAKQNKTDPKSLGTKKEPNARRCFFVQKNMYFFRINSESKNPWFLEPIPQSEWTILTHKTSCLHYHLDTNPWCHPLFYQWHTP